MRLCPVVSASSGGEQESTLLISAAHKWLIGLCSRFPQHLWQRGRVQTFQQCFCGERVNVVKSPAGIFSNWFFGWTELAFLETVSFLFLFPCVNGISRLWATLVSNLGCLGGKKKPRQFRELTELTVCSSLESYGSQSTLFSLLFRDF